MHIYVSDTLCIYTLFTHCIAEKLLVMGITVDGLRKVGLVVVELIISIIATNVYKARVMCFQLMRIFLRRE